MSQACKDQASLYVLITNLQKCLHIALFVGNAFEEFFSKKVFSV